MHYKNMVPGIFFARPNRFIAHVQIGETELHPVNEVNTKGQFFRASFGKKPPSGSYEEGTGKSGSYGMWNHPRGHVWNVFVRPASS